MQAATRHPHPLRRQDARRRPARASEEDTPRDESASRRGQGRAARRALPLRRAATAKEARELLTEPCFTYPLQDAPDFLNGLLLIMLLGHPREPDEQLLELTLPEEVELVAVHDEADLKLLKWLF